MWPFSTARPGRMKPRCHWAYRNGHALQQQAARRVHERPTHEEGSAALLHSFVCGPKSHLLRTLSMPALNHCIE